MGRSILSGGGCVFFKLIVLQLGSLHFYVVGLFTKDRGGDRILEVESGCGAGKECRNKGDFDERLWPTRGCGKVSKMLQDASNVSQQGHFDIDEQKRFKFERMTRCWRVPVPRHLDEQTTRACSRPAGYL